VTAEQNMLTVEGRKGEHQYLYPGHLHPCVPASVQPGRLRPGEGRLVQGRASADRLGAEVPEAMKPRRIAIESGYAAAESKQVDHKNAA
jgi:molecular chaperone IbpA